MEPQIKYKYNFKVVFQKFPYAIGFYKALGGSEYVFLFQGLWILPMARIWIGVKPQSTSTGGVEPGLYLTFTQSLSHF
jgi:hypothetical protein